MTKSLLGVALLIASGAFAQQPKPNPYTPVQPIPVGDILLTLPSSHMADAKTWEVKFSHRFNQSVDQGGAFRNLFGLDSGANVGLGLSYVPVRDLELAVLRSSSSSTYELSTKYAFVQQARAIPFALALRAGGDIRTARNLTDRTSYFGQAILSRQFGSRFDFYVVPTYVTNAGQTLANGQPVALFKHAFNAPVGALVQIVPGFSIVGEVIPKNRDLPLGLKTASVGWSAGVKRAIGGHLFEILLTNSNGMTVDQYITSTYNGIAFRSKDKRLGFNIERRWGKGVRR